VLSEEKGCAPSSWHGPVIKLGTSFGPPKKKRDTGGLKSSMIVQGLVSQAQLRRIQGVLRCVHVQVLIPMPRGDCYTVYRMGTIRRLLKKVSLQNTISFIGLFCKRDL